MCFKAVLPPSGSKCEQYQLFNSLSVQNTKQYTVDMVKPSSGGSNENFNLGKNSDTEILKVESHFY